MPDILIRNIPKELQEKLKNRAATHHRSMNKEAYAILEEALKEENRVSEIPEPYKGKFDLTEEFLKDAKTEGRE
jgi:plasmid stability protein